MAGNIVSFDIGSAQVKLVWLAGGACRAAAAAPVPDGLVRGGTIVSMDAMADFLHQMAREHGLPRHAAAAVVLPPPLVFTRITELPPMTEGQLTYNLPFEFKDYLTQEKNRYYFDYAVQELVRDGDGGVKRMKLFACAALKDTIESYRNMFTRAGFRMRLALPEEAAYAAVLTDYVARKQPESGDYCLVDVGHTGIRMYILRDGQFVTRRVIDLGMRDLIRSISQRQGVDEHIALAHMLSDYEGAMSEPESLDLYHRMAAEITKAVNFYNYNNRQQALRRVYLCGGGAAVAYIRDAIRQVAELEVSPAAELLPPLEGAEAPWRFVRALGGALQE